MRFLNILPQRLDAGATPTFTNLTVTGVALFANGTAAAPSICFASDTDTGFYRAATNVVGVSLGGVLNAYFAEGGILYGGTFANNLTLAANGSVSLTAAGNNQNITLTPSGTGKVSFENATTKWFFGEQSVGFGYMFCLPAATSPTTSNYTILNDGAGNLYFNTVGASGVMIFRQAVAEVAQFNASKRFLLGTGAVDSGALLQIGTNTTTSAGGMVFGTDTFLHRVGAGVLQLPAGQTFRTDTVQGVGSGAYISFGATSLLFATGATALTLDSSQNWLMRTMTVGTSGVGVIAIANGTAPSTSPAGGGQLYVESGALKYRGSSGTITTVGAA